MMPCGVEVFEKSLGIRPRPLDRGQSFVGPRFYFGTFLVKQASQPSPPKKKHTSILNTIIMFAARKVSQSVLGAAAQRRAFSATSADVSCAVIAAILNSMLHELMGNVNIALQGRRPRRRRWNWSAAIPPPQAEPSCQRARPLRYQGWPRCRRRCWTHQHQEHSML